MKRALSITVLLTVLLAATSRGQGSGFGVGVIVGDPTGISIKKWISDRRAIDGAIAWSLEGNDALQLHADYLLHYGDLFNQDPKAQQSGAMPVYYGIGGVVKFEDDENNNDNDNNDNNDFVGVRFPLGIDYVLKNHPLDFFVEIVPILQLIDETDIEIDAGLGARFYFR